VRPLTERLRPAWLAWLASVLAVEQVPLVWDKATGIEDFVRETRFSFTKESPTP